MPTKAARRRGRGWLLTAVALFALLLLGGGVYAFLYLRPPAARPDVLLHTVKKETLSVTVTEKGTLESAENKDVICEVKAGNKGFATTINRVIDDGSLVKKGQLLMVLDDSALQDQHQAQDIVVQTAFAAKVKAEKDYDIAVKDNERLIAEAENALVVAEIELVKYTGVGNALAAVCGLAVSANESGSYQQQLDDLTGQVRLAESDVEQNRERSAWADRMVKMKYMSPAQAQAERSRMDSSVEKLRSLQSQKTLLSSYEKKKSFSDLQSKVENARRLVAQKKLEAEAKAIQASIEKKTKVSVYLTEDKKLTEIISQIEKCKIYAPQDGMVVYFKNESSRFGSTPQGLIEQGAQVKEGQKLLRIPNLNVMQVNTKVHEAMVSRIKGDIRVPTGIFEGFRTGLLTNADPFSRLVSQKDDFLELVQEKYRDHEYYTASKGQRASVRVDAMSEQVFPARVRSVAGVASQADSWISDVKLYQTLVLIEKSVDGLKPDMTAEVTIHVDGVRDVLAVPLQSIIGGAEMGATRKLFVRTPTGYDEKEVVLGIYNDKMVEVKEGLAEGDEVVINPKVLLGDAKTKTRDGDNSKGGGDGKAWPGKGGAAPGGGDPTKKGPGGPGGPKAGAPGGGAPGGPKAPVQ